MTPDPLGLDGGDVNLYAYVGGSPTNYIDPLGLKASTCRANPKLNDPNAATVVCDGKGGMDVQYGWSKNAPPPIKDCVKEHELSHISDFNKLNPGVCKNVKKGTRVSFYCYTPGCSKQSECDAYKAELECLKKKCPDEAVKRRMRYLEKQIAKYCN